MRISVAALGDAFGRGRLSSRALAGIERGLERAGVAATPTLLGTGGEGWVTLRLAADAEAAPIPSAGLLMPSLPPRLAAATGVLMPLLLVVAVALADGPRPTASTAAPVARQAAPATPDAALRAGDYRRAIALAEATDPARIAEVRGRAISTLTAQAMAAQREGAYVRAIRLARRAARFGSAPGTRRIVVQSRAGLDLRRRGLSARR
jgi:hypothetical protein